MPVPHASANFGDLLDIRFQDIIETEKSLKAPASKLALLYDMVPTNGRNDLRYSNVGGLPDWEEFTGNVGYGAQNQGYDTTITPVEFTSGVQVERKLFDDDQFHIMDQKPRALVDAYYRTREKHGFRILNNAFSVDNYFYNNTEAVALCSDNHITTSGASTASGFDNKTTASCTATGVLAAYKQGRLLRGDQAQFTDTMMDELWVPIDLCDQAFEINASMGRPDTANNNANYLKGRFNIVESPYMTSTKNWFLMDSSLRKMFLKWTDRTPLEFAMVEDFDKLIAKWRGYARYGMGHIYWGFVVGSQVT